MIRTFKLRTRILIVLCLISLLPTGLVGMFALHYLGQTLQGQISQQASNIAYTVGRMPSVVQAVQDKNSALLQTLTKELAQDIGARFIVIGDENGVRLAHPKTGHIGKPMYDDDGDFNDPVFKQGLPYVQIAKGSMGITVRGKAPVFLSVPEQPHKKVIGIVSVGYLLDTVADTIAQYRTTLILVISIAFTASIIAAFWFAQHFKKAIFGLEPEQIGRLFEERNATLESIREGVIAINARGEITTFNCTALEMLDLNPKMPLTGASIKDILPHSKMLELLNSGTPQLDQEVWLKDKSLIINRLPVKRNNKIIGVVSSFRRKDELDKVSQKLNQTQQYADSLRSQAHEYSNKLHTIAGLIQIGATDKALALIGQETKGHQDLIQLLLAAAPDPILAGCLIGKYNRAREMGLHLIIDPESQMRALPPWLPKEKLVSILGNLIDNALEATYNYRGQGAQVHLSMTDLGNDLIFEIEDQGKGIKPEQQEDIFKKGVTTKAGKGHGLGLYLVKSFLKQINGTITLEPGDSEGSRFTVYIPKERQLTDATHSKKLKL